MLTVYRASAGAGKTHTLTGEYLKMLFGGKGQEGEATYRHILAVTFTNKATASSAISTPWLRAGGRAI